jgi:hypothetical protein
LPMQHSLQSRAQYPGRKINHYAHNGCSYVIYLLHSIVRFA